MTDDGTASPSVCVVLLTFNAPDRIEKSVPAILAQSRPVDAAVFVDNHSTDETPRLLTTLVGDHDEVTVLRTEDNLGPAGGFHVGMAEAMSTGCDLLWLLDDDSVPDPTCLETLLRHVAEGGADIWWPRNIDEHGRDSSYPAWRGEILTAELVERGGLPREEFFWGQEDTEYLQWRLPREHGAVSTQVPDAIVRHEMGNPRKATSWHFYYLTRNTVHYRLHIQRPRQVRRLVRSMLRMWARAAFREEHPARNLWFAMRGLFDGLRGRLGKTVDPASFTAGP